MPNGSSKRSSRSGDALDAPAGQKTTYYAHGLTVKCEHASPEASGAEVSLKRTSRHRTRFEVVPDADDGTDVVDIFYEGSASLHGPKKLKSVGGNEYRLPCAFPEEENTSDPFADADFWNEIGKSRSYVVKGLREDLEVTVYSPHEYEFALEFPALGSISRGRKVSTDLKKRPEKGYKRETTTETTDKWETWNPRSGEQRSAEVTQTQSSDPSVPGEVELEADAQLAGPSVSYRVDGRSVSLDVLELIGGILELGQKIVEILETIQDNVPKVGWYFEADLSIMEGSMVLAWGMKEHSDHRAYLWMGADLGVDVLGVDLELGVGVEAAGTGVQVFGKIAGTLGVALSCQRPSPDWEASIGLPLETTITGGLGLRAEAPAGIRVEGTVETSLVINGTLDVGSSEGLSISTGIEWTGIEANMTAEVGFFGSWGSAQRTETLVGSTNLGRWEWPGGKQYQPVRTSRARTKEILAERFSKGWNIEVWNREGPDLGPNEMAERITPHLDKKPIARDEKTIEALGFEINNHFEEQFDGEMYLYQFDNFCLGELRLILDGYIDPLQECKKKVA
jgi:hypothetical protein